jgi:hypothetical protein
MAMIDVMVFEPGLDGQRRTIDDSLDSMQSVVGGYIEHVPVMNPATGVAFKGLVIVCNEEGRLKKLPTNRWGFVGSFVVARTSGKAYASLNENDLKIIQRLVIDDVSLAPG